MAKPPSPCIDVCKYKREGRCIGCGMTRPEKKAFKTLGARQRRAFIDRLVALQAELGGFAHWAPAYRRRCAKKDRSCPLDEPHRADAA